MNGYEVEKYTHVAVTDDEFASFAPERSHSIETDSFIETSEANPVLYDRPYSLLPRTGGEKAYGLLLNTLRDTKKTGVAKFVLRNREHLVAVWAVENLLSLMMMHFPEEIRDPAEIKPSAKTNAKSVNSMVSVMEKHKSTYSPDKYADTYRKKVITLF